MSSVVPEPSTKAGVVWPILLCPTVLFLTFFFFFKQIFILNTFPIHSMCFVKLGWAARDSTHCNVGSRNGGGGSGSFEEGCGERDVGIGTRLRIQKLVSAKVGQFQGARLSDSCP